MLVFSVEVDASGSQRLVRKLKADVKSGMKKIKAMAEEEIRNSIESNIYGSLGGGGWYSPISTSANYTGEYGAAAGRYYSNTKQLVNAFTIKVSGTNITAYMDPAKASYPSWFGQGDFAEGLMQSFEEGGGPGISPFGNPTWLIPATGYWDMARSIIEVEMVNEMRNHLASCGWNVS